MDDKILNQIRYLKKYIALLQELSVNDNDTFLNDEILKGATQRYLQLAIETCINIGNRIIAIEQLNKSLRAPETYADVFDALVKIDLLDDEFAAELKNMARFRNKLVHVYWELDDKYIYQILTTKIGDFEKYLKFASQYISRKNK